MMIRSEQMQLYPVSRELIGKKAKRFIFWTVLLMHGAVFVVPMLWFILKSWLTPPPPKAISVTLVSKPTSEPHSSRGTKSSSQKSNKKESKDVSAPEPGDIPDIADNIPDVPDVPDVPKIKPRTPKKPPVKNVEKAPSKTPEKPQPSKTQSKPVPKKTNVEQIQEWRKKHGGKTIKVTRNPGKTSGNSNAQTLQNIAKDVEGLIGNGGTADSGAGGVFDEYAAMLINHIQAAWKRYAPNDMGTKVMIPLYFEVDGRGNVLRCSIRQRCGIAVVDAAVDAMLRNMRRLPAPPDGKRQNFTVNLRVGEAF